MAPTVERGFQRTFTYDAYGRPSSSTWQIDGAGYTITPTYDALGRLEWLQLGNGQQVDYDYYAPTYKGGRLSREMPVQLSNVKLVCTACGAAARTGSRIEADGGKVRYCKKCNVQVDKG